MELKTNEFNLLVKYVLLITIAVMILTSFFVIGAFLLYPLPENFTNILLTVIIVVQLFTGIIIIRQYDMSKIEEINKRKR